MSYEIKGNRIETEKCELNIVHHCNLACRGCSHLSPRTKKFFVSPDKIFDDFSILAKSYHPQCISLLGGEPLLHPDLLSVIDAVRQAGISECIRIVTNGVLLSQMPDLFWQSVDQVHISLYPGHKMGVEKLKAYQRRARQYGVDLELRYVDCFREPCSELGTKDLQLIGRIYRTCKTAHLWRCHTVCEGYIFRCPQSVFIPRILRDGSKTNDVTDGLKIVDSRSFTDDLLAFLLSKRPLDSCRYCLGTVGRRFIPIQESQCPTRTPRPTEALVDWGYLNKTETRGLRISSWLRLASVMTKRVMARMPPAMRLHPSILLWKAAIRNIHPVLK